MVIRKYQQEVEEVEMKTIGVALLTALLAVSVGVTASYAHHAFGAIYESSKQVAFDQVKIVSVAWTNPHTRIAFDVTEENGNVIRWDTETGSPSALSRIGWLRNAVKPGESSTLPYNRRWTEPTAVTCSALSCLMARSSIAAAP